MDLALGGTSKIFLKVSLNNYFQKFHYYNKLGDGELPDVMTISRLEYFVQLRPIHSDKELRGNYIRKRKIITRTSKRCMKMTHASVRYSISLISRISPFTCNSIKLLSKAYLLYIF